MSTFGWRLAGRCHKFGHDIPHPGPVVPKWIVTGRHMDAETIVPHLFEELTAIRRRGYAIDDEEHAVGVRCVAAPVFAASGEVVAAIGVSGTVSQVNDDYMASLGKIVQTAALKLSAQLGGRRSR